MKSWLICIVLMIGGSYANASDVYLAVGTGWSDAQLAVTTKSGQESSTLKYNGSGPSNALLGGFKLKLSSELYSALETNVQLSGADLKDTNNNDEWVIKQTSSFGITALVGKKKGAGELYGRLGFQLANYKISDKEAGFPEEDREAETSHYGLRLGIGSEFVLGNFSHLRMDWNRTFYNKKVIRKEDDVSELLKPTETIFLIGVIRQF